CHTRRGGPAYAGGRAIETPFGTVYGPNLTPDAATGLGRWSASEFWRALHNGRARDGRLLYPALPYPSFTRVSRADSDALYAYLQSLPAVRAPNRPPELRFPYRLQAALAVWRALYFSPAAPIARAPTAGPVERGAYLVQGLGHCAACHAPRNALGASADAAALPGGLIPVRNWYAPPLGPGREPGVAPWTQQDLVDLLQGGESARGSAMGPMAEVVARSTQYLGPADLHAIAAYLMTLPPGPLPEAPPQPVAAAQRERGAGLYGDHCADCHGKDGRGVAGAYPPLAGNRGVVAAAPDNLVKAILDGGFAPSTRTNPRPFGMPPFGPSLGDAEIAAIASYVRSAWGHEAGAVSSLEVQRARGQGGG
ncbi:MAG: cytochrome c, partial [Burkholderiales bacterium]|nr:cytochrome c [Burkholderiales bacterium]